MNKNKQIKYKLEMILYIIQLKFGFFEEYIIGRYGLTNYNAF